MVKVRNLFIFIFFPSWVLSQKPTAENWGGYRPEAEAYLKKLNFLQALEPLKKSKQWFENKKLTQTYDYVLVLTNLGECYYQIYELDQAEEHYSQGIELLSENKSIPKSSGLMLEFAYAVSHLAHIYSLKGDFENAKDFLDVAYKKLSYKITESLKQNVILDTIITVASLYKSYGDLYFAQNDLQNAENYYTKALRVAEQDKTNDLNRLNVYGSIVLAIADMYDVQGLSHKQIEMLEKLINFYEALGSDALLKVKEYVLALKKAGEHYAKVYNVEKDEYNKNEIKEKAARYIHTALKIQESISQDNAIYADVVLAMSRYLLFTEPGRAETAFKLAKMSFLLFYKNYKQHHIKHIESANLAGFIALYLKNYQEAEKLFTLALKAMPVLNDVYHIYNLHLHFNIGLAMMYQGKTALAALSFSNGASIIEEQLRRNFAHLTEKEREALYKTFNENILLYAYFVSENYAQMPELSHLLFNLLLPTKGFMFNQNRVFIKSIQQSSNENLKKKFQKWLELKAELARKQQSVNISERNYYQSGKSLLDNKIEQLEKEIASENIEFQKKVVESNGKKRTTWNDIKNTLKDDEALVEIVRTYSFKNGFHQDSAIYLALIVKPKEETIKLIKLNNGFRMENGNLKYYRNCIRFKRQDEESYKAYWEPIAQELRGVKKIYFCPDGVYHFINLLTLLNPVTNTFVNDEFEIQMISRSADLIEMKEKQSLQNNFENYQVYLFGYPDYRSLPTLKGAEKQNMTTPNNPSKHFQQQRFLDLGTGAITSLPGTKKEIENVASYAQRAKIKTQIFQELQANEENLKKVQAPYILHISTHGFFIEEGEIANPLLRSGLILAGAELALKNLIPESLENGILTAQEVLNLDLENTELVVLSACETGLGEVKNGEGVYGLQRAFLQAGSKSIIVSLWKVDDMATQEFMSSFYENWLIGKMSKSKAFAQARQNIKQKYQHPYYWGAFVLVGE